MMQNNTFYLDDYIKIAQSKKQDNDKQVLRKLDKFEQFMKLCENVKDYFNKEWENQNSKRNETYDLLLQTQKRAIIGYSKEVNYFKDKINEYLRRNQIESEWYPSWYDNLTSAIFHENWGLSGLIQWKNMPESSSAKIIGERIYFLINGRQVLQEQTISPERVKQLKKALLLRSPEKRMDESYAEVYMLDGTRITIYDEGLAKEPTIVFRKYIVDRYTFEEQAKRGTIPAEAVKMFKAMVKVGYNVNFVGPVRSGKTTFLETWQSYEDPSLEGIQIETDPEIPLDKLMPKAPIIQLVSDGEPLKKIMKLILRGDGDYIIGAEARDGIAMNILVKAGNKGTRRVKGTFHTGQPEDFCYDAAQEIIEAGLGGDLYTTIVKVAKTFHYLFEFVQLKDKSKKRLKGIYEIRYNPQTVEITIHKICKYDFLNDTWTFKYDIGKDKEEIAYEEDYEAFMIFNDELKKLAEKYPMTENHIIYPSYNHFMRK